MREWWNSVLLSQKYQILEEYHNSNWKAEDNQNLHNRILAVHLLIKVN